MQVNALRLANTSYNLSVAQQQLIVMAQRLRVIKQSDYQLFIQHWNQQNQQVLPQGQGVVMGNYPHYHLTIAWGGQTASACQQNTVGLRGCLMMEVSV